MYRSWRHAAEFSNFMAKNLNIPAIAFEAGEDIYNKYNNKMEDLDPHIKEQHKFLNILDFGGMYNLFLDVENMLPGWEIIMEKFPKMPLLPKQIVNSSYTNSFIEEFGCLKLDKIRGIYDKDYKLIQSIRYNRVYY